MHSTDISDYKITNLPKFHSLDVYNRCIDNYVNTVSKYGDVVAIYQCGNISVEGISDIDLIVVLKDSLTTTTKADYEISRFDSFANYTFTHNPFIVNSAIFCELQKLFFIEDTTHLYGEMLRINSLSTKRKKYYALDINIKRIALLLRSLNHAFISRNLAVRDLLASLNSLVFTINSVKNITCRCRGYWFRYVSVLRECRENWFSRALSQNLSDLICLNNMAISICHDLIHDIDDYLHIHYPQIMDDLSEKKVFENFRLLIIYTDRYNLLRPDKRYRILRYLSFADSTSKRAEVLRYLLEFQILFLPLSFFAILQKSFAAGAVYPQSYRPLLKTLLERKKSMDEHVSFLVRNGFNYGAFFPHPSLKDMYSSKRKTHKQIIQFLIRLYNYSHFKWYYRTVF